MRAVWSTAKEHIPFASVLFVSMDYAPKDDENTTLRDTAYIHLIDGQHKFALQGEAIGEFMSQWYAWLDGEVEVEFTPAPHPRAQWGHEEMRQAQEERRHSFTSDANLQKMLRNMKRGQGIDVT